jgi:hypothetical protein
MMEFVAVTSFSLPDFASAVVPTMDRLEGSDKEIF